MTRPSLAGIEKRAAAATAGPWFQGRKGRPYESTCDVYSKREPDEPDSHDIATCVHSEEDAEFIAHARTDVDALVEAVRDVLARHAPEWPCGNPRHANPDGGCPECGDSYVDSCADCGQSWPCSTVYALATHLDLTDPEGDPT